MLEILAISFFAKKIRKISYKKNIKASKWIWRLILTWFGVELLVVIGYLILSGDDFENSIAIFIPAIVLAAASAFYTVKKLEKQPDNLQLEED